MLNSLQNSRCSLIYRSLRVHTTTPTISKKTPFLHFSQFSPHYYPLLVHKTIFIIHNNTSFLYNSFFTFLFLRTAISSIYNKSVFNYLNHLANTGCVKGPLHKGFLWGLTLLYEHTREQTVFLWETKFGRILKIYCLVTVLWDVVTILILYLMVSWFMYLLNMLF